MPEQGSNQGGAGAPMKPLPGTLGKLAVHAHFDLALVGVCYYFRIAFDCQPTPQHFIFLQLPTDVELDGMEWHVEPLGFHGDVFPSTEMVVRAARALSIPFSNTRTPLEALPSLQLTPYGRILALHVPPLSCWPNSIASQPVPPPSSYRTNATSRSSSSSRTPKNPPQRNRRGFLLALHAVAKYGRMPPDDVHAVRLPRPYALNNRLRVSASESVLDIHSSRGSPAMDLDPICLETRRHHTRRASDQSETESVDAGSTYRSGSEYGPDELGGEEGESFFAGGFTGGKAPITIRWGPAPPELSAAQLPTLGIDRVPSATLALTPIPNGRVSQPTYFHFVCTITLRGLHQAWITEGGVVRYVSHPFCYIQK